MELNLDLPGLTKEINKIKKSKKIVLQVPEGLKTRAQEIVSKIETDTKKQCYLSIEPVYGACDVASNFSNAINGDLIVHLGHTEFKKVKDTVIYWPTYYETNKKDIDQIIKEIDSKFSNKKICIVGPIQYQKIILEIEKKLEKTKIQKTQNTNLLLESQILGCDTSNVEKIIEKVDCILFLGDGNFHITAITKDVDIYRLSNNKIERYFPKQDIRKKIMSEYIFKNSKNVGILVTSKTGQNNYLIAEKIYDYLKKSKKAPILLIADFISYDKILGLNLDCLINTACPRIIDDKENYKIPVINYKDIITNLK